MHTYGLVSSCTIKDDRLKRNFFLVKNKKRHSSIYSDMEIDFIRKELSSERTTIS